MKWYKHVPDKWRAGTIGMTFEEKGLHIDLIDLYVDRDGNLSDDDDLLVRLLGCRPQVWRRLKAALIRKGKLQAGGGWLLPNGCETTLKEAVNFSAAQSVRARKPRRNSEFCGGFTGVSPEFRGGLKEEKLEKTTNGASQGGLAYTSSHKKEREPSLTSEPNPAREAPAEPPPESGGRESKHPEIPISSELEAKIQHWKERGWLKT